MLRELIVPPDAKETDHAVELLRGWIVNGRPQYVLLPTVWKNDLASWGRFLADTANHVANAIAEDTGRNREEVLNEIKTSLFHHLQLDNRWHEGQFFDPDTNDDK